MKLEIQEYSLQHPSYKDYDPQAPLVAAALSEAITSIDDRLRVEHVGSSSVPGCGGKGYIDLVVIYRDGELDVAKRALAALGFQHQRGRDPWPESRPMRVGVVVHEGQSYPIHAHVVAGSSNEVAELLRFREALRSNAHLARAYEAEKRRVLSEGVLDGVDYAERKSSFVKAVIGSRTA
jgi:GrpB-like predicted nucleotidyltransferase (UPF0157 family)